MNKPLICLASASPRRAALLSQIGLAYEVRVADIDETLITDEAPEAYVLRMALEKAKAVLMRDQAQIPGMILAADTAVVVDGVVLGKPRDQIEGLAMLERLSGRAHEVLTAVALLDSSGRRKSCLSVSKVVFRVTTAAERLAYWRTGEPIDKAGAYGVQGYAAIFIENLQGSFSGVMGMPLFETAELLREFGIDVSDNWVG